MEEHIINVVEETEAGLLTIEMPPELGGGNYFLRHNPKERYAGVAGRGDATVLDQDYTGQERVVAVRAREVTNSYNEDRHLQVFSVLWSDNQERYLSNCPIVPIVLAGDDKRTAKERRADLYAELRNRTLEGLATTGGENWRMTAGGQGIAWEEIASDGGGGWSSHLFKFNHPAHGIIYGERFGNVFSLYGSSEVVEQAFQAYAEQVQIAPETSLAWLQKFGSSRWREVSDEIAARGCVGQEFHEWNAGRVGFTSDIKG